MRLEAGDSDSLRTPSMCNFSGSARFALLLTGLLTTLLALTGAAFGQRQADSEFGPVVSAYLGYLNNEQEVVDDRASRREITSAYYRRNSNRIHALRQMTVRLARQSGNDYVPELEAVTADEFGTIFEHPPHLTGLRSGEVVANKFRFLGAVRMAETFYLFARLDPYEQADLMQRSTRTASTVAGANNGQSASETSTRSRRVVPR
jgi:hypothetical protein